MANPLQYQPTEFDRAVQRKRKLIAKHMGELGAMLENCPHTNTVNKTHHYEGGYLNKAYTDYWTECVVCNARFDEHTKQHNYYG